MQDIKRLMEINPIRPLDSETYSEYIKRIKQVRPNKKYAGVYMERHHIKPRSMGGDNKRNNLIYLLAQEHYYAHKLLALELPESKEMQLAWNFFIHGRKSFNKYKKDRPEIFVSADEFALAKELAVKTGAFSHPWTEERKKYYKEHYSGENSPFYKREMSKEWRQKISESKKARVRWKHTEETKNKMSKSAINKPKSEDAKKHMSQAQSEKWSKDKWWEEQTSIICLNTKIVYPNSRIAGEDVGVSARSIVFAVSGETKTCGLDLQGKRMTWQHFKDYQGSDYIFYLFDSEKWAQEIERLKKDGIGYTKKEHPLKGKHNLVNSKPIYCITTNKSYSSIKEASIETGMSETSFQRALNGKQSFCGVTETGERMEWIYK